MKRLPIVLAVLFLGTTPLRAQNLTRNLSDVSDAYARAYVAPLIDAYGANINAGLFHSAKIGGGMLPKVDLYLGVKVFGALLPSNRSFSMTYQTSEVYTAPNGNRYVVPVTFNIEEAPTVFGETDPGAVSVLVDETIDSPDGPVVVNDEFSMDLLPGIVNTPVAPLLVPQIGIGSYMGTDVIVRYLPTLKTESYGSISFRGAGIRHSISQYFPLFPADISAQLVYQRLSMKDEADKQTLLGTAYAFNVAVSKSFTVITVYGGLQLEKTKVEIDYDFDTGEPEIGVQTIRFSQQAKNRFRTIAGLSFSPGPIQLNVDYALGSLNTVSAGLGIAL